MSVNSLEGDDSARVEFVLELGTRTRRVRGHGADEDSLNIGNEVDDEVDDENENEDENEDEDEDEDENDDENDDEDRPRRCRGDEAIVLLAPATDRNHASLTAGHISRKVSFLQ